VYIDCTNTCIYISQVYENHSIIIIYKLSKGYCIIKIISQNRVVHELIANEALAELAISHVRRD